MKQSFLEFYIMKTKFIIHPIAGNEASNGK